MNTTARRILTSMGLAGLLAIPTAAQAQPSALPIQGYLTDSGGYPVDGQVLVTFSLYTAPSGGAAFFTETRLTDVDLGSFTAYLGDQVGSPLNLAHFDSGGEVYLGVAVDGELEMLPRIRIGTVPYAARARRAQTAATVPWSGITGIPADLADGDADTPYYATPPLIITGTTVGLDAAGCVAGEGWVWNGTDWECMPSAAVNYTAGAGLVLTGTEFAVNTTTVQARISETCPVGQSIRAISSTGTVSCQADVRPLAGTGTIVGTDGTVSVDSAAVQSRITGACLPGDYMIGVNADGSVECDTLPTAITYGAGDGLRLAGSDFAIDDTETQRRIGGTCAGGAAIRAVNSDGTVVCQSSVQSVTAGAGITITGSPIAPVVAVDTAAIQARVSETCAAGSYVRAINADGTVECEAVPAALTYGADPGSGLDLVGSNFQIDPNETQKRVTGTCAGGQYMTAIDSNGAVTCVALPASVSYNALAGSGLDLVGSNFQIDPNETQRRVTGTCEPGYSVRSIAVDGTVICEYDDDTDTTYTGGTGITLTGTSFSANTSYLQRRVSGTCAAGSAMATIQADGTVLCNTMPSVPVSDVQVEAGVGLTRNASAGTVTIGVQSGFYQRATSVSCGANQYVASIASNGTANCANLPTITNTVTGGGGVTVSATSGNITLGTDANTLQRRVTGTCAAGQVMLGIDVNGNVSCGSDLVRDNVSNHMVRRNATLTSGGWIHFTANSRLVWDGRIITIADAMDSTIPAGHFNINCPGRGLSSSTWPTEGAYLRRPDQNDTTFTWDGTLDWRNYAQYFAHCSSEWDYGFFIPGWWALWYILPTGSGDVSSRKDNFRLGGYWLAPQVPAEWMLVAYQNGDTGTLFVNVDGGVTLRPGESYHPHFGGQGSIHARLNAIETRIGAGGTQAWRSCYWTGTLNNYDAYINHTCANGFYYAGQESWHNNHFEDRQFNMLCCTGM